MTQPQYALSWDSYKTNICSGFSSLQQNAEFVDMTLAADGHFVKVHQILVALASPYIKELIASTPCQHPVIFLNNVSNKVLTYLLEFIYTGEVVVPSDNLPSFMEAAKSLHIKGLEGIGDDPSFIPNDDMYSIGSQHEQEIAPRTKGVKRKATTSISETLDTTMEEQSVIEEDVEETFLPELSPEPIEDSTERLPKIETSVKTDVFSEIIPYKGESRWFTRAGEYYVVTRSRKDCLRLRCANLKCEVQWNLRAGKASPIKGKHNHKRTPWVPDRNAMFQALKGRVTMDNIPLKDIYNEEAARYPNAAPHLLFENVVPSMRKWRRQAQEEEEIIDYVCMEKEPVSLPRSARKVVVMPENSLQNLQPSKIQIKADSDFTNDFPDLADSGTQDSDDGVKLEEATDAETEKVKSATSNLLFTVSIRGSLQVILNRYIYNLNSTTTKAGLRRWRCVDYRNNKCTAFLVTKGNVVMNRANPHTHPFHDKKILAKIEKKAVFSALDDVEAYRDKEKELDKQDRIEERQLNEELILG